MSFWFLELPDPVAHWPLSESSHLSDVSSNALPLEVVSGLASFGVDSINSQSYLLLDGSLSARVSLNSQLRMSSDWTSFFAFRGSANALVFVLGDETSNMMSHRMNSDQLLLSTSVSLFNR